ncbi:hypothetical protein BHE74_00046115 [Ensete ventricosum]|nr:hypothetical protein GW17_00056635 [Ensete ventricosum]RWW47864.1 hypothetical protein BHE74_00046115 [Ensete ventricosum]RZS26586.1 hypothetical protein BHM03_00059950 [Ensete ventricosum]
MTIKQKSPTSGSSIHPCLGEAKRGRQSIAGSNHNSLYHFWKRFTLSHKHRSPKGYVNKGIGTHRKHMRNNETCMRLYKIIRRNIN